MESEAFDYLDAPPERVTGKKRGREEGRER
jgi:hypothetical protein